MERLVSRAHAWVSGLLMGMLLCTGLSARAAIVTDLYEASVPVPDQSAAARSVALQQALAAVLVKVTGERSAGNVPALVNLIKDPSQFLSQYRYTQAPATSGTPALTYYDLTRTGTPAIPFTGLLLSAHFDPEVVDQAVRAAHEPLWGQERPRTLVWIVLQNGSNVSIVSASNNPVLVQTMNSAAQQRGVPLVFPAMNAADQQAIGIPDITQNNTARIQQASQRYPSDATLVGTIYMTTPGQYAARWQLTVGTKTTTWTTPTSDLASVAADGVQTTADNYTKWFALAPDAVGLNGVMLSVSGIDGVDAYAKVLAYLGQLTPVKSVQVTRVQNHTVYFSLDTRGDLANLQQAVLLGDLLKTTAPAVTSYVTPSNVMLQFQYTP